MIDTRIVLTSATPLLHCYVPLLQVMLDSCQCLKLSDFSLARQVEEEEESTYHQNKEDIMQAARCSNNTAPQVVEEQDIVQLIISLSWPQPLQWWVPLSILCSSRDLLWGVVHICFRLVVPQLSPV